MTDNLDPTQPQAENPAPAEQPKEPVQNTPFVPAMQEQAGIDIPSTPPQTQTPAVQPVAQNTQIPPTKKAEPSDVEKNKLITILSYIWILFLVPLLAKHGSEFAKFHAKQGAVLFVAWLVLYVFCIMIIGPVAGWRARQVLIGLVALGTLVYSILGIMHVLNGNMEKLPFIGQYANKINI